MEILPTWLTRSKAPTGGKDARRSRREGGAQGVRLSLPKVSLRTILLVLLAAALVLYAAPRLTESWRTSMAAETASLEARVTELDNKISDVDSALAERAAVEEALAQAATSVPDDPALAEVITSLESAVATNGMTWVSGAPGQESSSVTTEEDVVVGGVGTGGPGRQWAVSMTVVGPAARLAPLLDSLQSLPRLIAVDTVSWQVLDTGVLSVTLDARFFAMTDPSAQSDEGVVQ